MWPHPVWFKFKTFRNNLPPPSSAQKNETSMYTTKIWEVHVNAQKIPGTICRVSCIFIYKKKVILKQCTQLLTIAYVITFNTPLEHCLYTPALWQNFAHYLKHVIRLRYLSQHSGCGVLKCQQTHSYDNVFTLCRFTYIPADCWIRTTLLHRICPLFKRIFLHKWHGGVNFRCCRNSVEGL